MASATAVTLQINGVDRTRGVFAALQARLAVLGARVRVGAARILSGVRSGIAALPGFIGGALSRVRNVLLATAAAATALGAATVGAAKSFSTLSDRAAQAGTTSDELDRLTTALSIGGAKNANLDTVADAFARMTKATGRTGMEGFRETLATIAAIGDEAGRVQELSRVFGRAFGPSLAAFVRQGPDALMQGLDGVMGALSRVSNRAVDAGDAIADGFDIAKRGILRSIQQVLVNAASRAFGKIGLDARGAGVLVAGYAEVYGGVLMRNLGPIWDRIKIAFENLPQLVRAALKLALAEVADFVVSAGNWVGLLLAAWAGVQLAMGNVVGAAVTAAADVALAAGLSKLESAGAAARAEADEIRASVSDMFASARPVSFGLTDAERRRLDEVEERARKITSSMNQLVTGAAAAGEEMEESARASLGPLRDAQAALAGSYEAFKISQQRGLGGSNGGMDARRAASATAQNTGRMVHSLDDLSRTAQATYAALRNSNVKIYTLE